ncbi:MAG: hypothetical protein K6G84_12935 [Lachnospiraceae bacterium]|nr:hypothetical protein [Lachnospiraceae bacterium]
MNNMDEREDYTELSLLVSDNETIGYDDMYNTNGAYETSEKNIEDKENKSKNEEGNHNEKKRNPVVVVFVVIAALIFVFALKKGKTAAKNEEVHKDEKNK